MPFWKKFLFTIATLTALYAMGRLYYFITDGFAERNILADEQLSREWQERYLKGGETTSLEISTLPDQVGKVLQQTFHYLTKGCQSYVFASSDGLHVLKLIKHQRFRTQPWLDLLTWIPAMERYRQERLSHKREKLFHLYWGWKTAAEMVPETTGVFYLQLVPPMTPSRTVTLIDKAGLPHRIDLSKTQFLLQRRATPLQTHLEKIIDQCHWEEGKQTSDLLLETLLDLYHRGYADDDDALLQNSGWLNARPLLIDVGQLHPEPRAKEWCVWKKALENKAENLGHWLRDRAPILYQHLRERLEVSISFAPQEIAPSPQ